MTASRGIFLRYYAYRATISLGFYEPVSVIYLLDQGYGLSFVALMQAVFSVSLLLAELPSGYLGDRLGRRRTLAVGSGLRVAGLLGYVFVDTATGYLFLKVLFGAGWAFRSGTTDAWLYDILASEGRTDRFARIDGRGNTALLGASAVGAVAGGVLYGSSPAAPFVANAALAALGVPILASVPAVDRAGSTQRSPTLREAVGLLRTQLGRPSIRWVVAYTVTLFLVFDLTRTFEQPALDAVGIPTAGIGALFAGFKLCTAGFASLAGWFDDRLGARGTLALATPVLGLAYGALAVAPMAVVPVLFCYRGVRAVLRPVRNQYVNERLDGPGRATVLSGISMILSTVGAIARLVGGEIAAVTGPVTFLAGAGVGLALASGGLWLAVSPVRPAADGRSTGGPAVDD